MNETIVLRISGEVEQPLELTAAALAAVDSAYQVPDVRQLDPQRPGEAVRLEGLLALARPKPTARWLGLHSATDDFHASIPLAAVRPRAIVIYRLDGQPLPVKAGGPARFYIPDHAACQTDEIDECANVKFVDTIELTAERGLDNRPQDEDEHARLHQAE